MRWTLRATCAWTVSCALAASWGCGGAGTLEDGSEPADAVIWSGDLVVETSEQLEASADITHIHGNLRLSPQAELEVLELPSLVEVSGGIVLADNTSVEALRMPELRLAGCLSLHGLHALERVELGNLARLTRRDGENNCADEAALSVTNNPGLTRLALAELGGATDGILVAENAALEEVVLPQLRRASGPVALLNNASLHQFDARSLESAAGGLALEHNPQLRWDLRLSAEAEALSIEFCAGGQSARHEASAMLLDWQAAGHDVEPCMEDLERQPHRRVVNSPSRSVSVQLTGLGEIGTLELHSAQQAVVDLGDLQVISGDLIVQNVEQLRSFRAPWLREIRGRLMINDVGALKAVAFPSLDHVTGEVRIRRVENMRAALFPKLRRAGSPFMIARNPEATSLHLPALTSARLDAPGSGEVCFLDNPQLTELPALGDLEEGTEVLYCLRGRRPTDSDEIAARWRAQGLTLASCEDSRAAPD